MTIMLYYKYVLFDKYKIMTLNQISKEKKNKVAKWHNLKNDGTFPES